MMGRTSMLVRLARQAQRFPLWIFRFMEWPIAVIYSKKNKKTPAVFLLALPRSGSTVTYQTICHGLSVNYLSNLWNLLYQLPLLGGWLSSFKTRRHRSDFRSQHGFVSGLDGPAEGLRFWRYWLDCGLSHLDCHTLPSAKRERRSRYLRRVVCTLSGGARPFVTAYLGHPLEPDRVYEAFPGAVLVRLRREPVSNALSLLNAIRRSGANWFSVRPRECEDLENCSEHEQVAAQVYWLNRRLDLASCAGKMLTVHYEKLCVDPAGELKRIHDWCNQKGVPVKLKFDLPKHFYFNRADLENDLDAIKIRQALDKLETEYGKLEVVE